MLPCALYATASCDCGVPAGGFSPFDGSHGGGVVPEPAVVLVVSLCNFCSFVSPGLNRLPGLHFGRSGASASRLNGAGLVTVDIVVLFPKRSPMSSLGAVPSEVITGELSRELLVSGSIGCPSASVENGDGPVGAKVGAGASPPRSLTKS